MQIGKWFLERRADDEENFPELPPEAEGGSNAIGQVVGLAEPKGSKSVSSASTLKGTLGTALQGTNKPGKLDTLKPTMGSTARGGAH